MSTIRKFYSAHMTTTWAYKPVRKGLCVPDNLEKPLDEMDRWLRLAEINMVPSDYNPGQNPPVPSKLILETENSRAQAKRMYCTLLHKVEDDTIVRYTSALRIAWNYNVPP